MTRITYEGSWANAMVLRLSRGYWDGELMKHAFSYLREHRCMAGHCTVALLLAMATGVCAWAQATPPASTVGGAQVVIPEDNFPEPVEAAAFPIPPGPERFLDPDDENRIFIEQFSIVGVSDRPKFGIDI